MGGDEKGALCAVLGTRQVQTERKMRGEIEGHNFKAITVS